MSTKHKAKSMTLRKPGLQDPLSSPPSPESEGPGTHTLPGGAAWPGGAEMNILEAIKLLRSEIVEMKTQVVATIEARIQEVSDTLKADLTILRNETVPAITLLKTTTASHTTTIAALETSATYVSDLTTSLEAEVKRLAADLKKVKESCVSLEGFSLCNNLRLVSVPEPAEMHLATDFVSGLLKDVLALDEKLLIDRAHRSLNPKPRDGERPRDIILRVHFFHEKMEILRRARNTTLSFQGQSFSIYQDYSPTVSRQRAAFGQAKPVLWDHPSVKYGLRVPARLWISHEGKDYTFESPDEAMAHIQRHIKKS
ncbi:uncharacterized protein LOC127906535 [Oncorhynchus keta]|uniref:uncharacterized protein LOC127906535 n=1 Tax=Oncorhynchus keta TaxID=8018 RepID=UPI00227CF8DC|nr:uncharacterized protein LOC127906535 [Oncorhynchus keta]